MLANENRLLILCHLGMEKEIAVGDLAAAVGLSQSALSQHLAKMRAEGLALMLLGSRKQTARPT